MSDFVIFAIFFAALAVLNLIRLALGPTPADRQVAGDNADILNGEGQDANTVRIDNNQTPLAGPASAGLAAIQDNPAIAAGILAAVAAAALLAFFVVKRRRKDDDEADVPTEGEGR